MSHAPLNFDRVEQIKADLVRELDEVGEAGCEAVHQRYVAHHPDINFDDELGLWRFSLKYRSFLGDGLGDGNATPVLRDFTELRLLKRGGMGIIYEAVQKSLKRKVALKTIRSDRLRNSPEAQSRFRREQKALAELHHTHIVAIHEAGEENGVHYFAMPLIRGAALSDVVHSISGLESSQPGTSTPTLGQMASTLSSDPVNDVRRLSERRADDASPAATESRPTSLLLSGAYLTSVAEVMASAADAIHHAHKAGVRHRDLKPSNIMVDGQGHCWIIDFGLAALRNGRDDSPAQPDGEDSAPEFAASGVMGTDAYMAPEQFERVADERTDVWGLGATLYELLTLRRPFVSRTEIESSSRVVRPRDRVRSLPRDLEAICLKALNKDRKKRYVSAAELRDDLQSWLRQQPVRARPGLAHRVLLWSCRNAGWAAAILASLIASIAMAGVAVAFYKNRAEVAEVKGNAAILEKNAAEEQKQAARRESFILRLKGLRDSDHVAGWSDDAWELVRRIKKIGVSNELKEEAPATLLGPDAKTLKTIDFQPDIVTYDPSGKRLLMAKTAPEDPRNPGKPREEEVRIWDSATDEIRVLPQRIHDHYGPITYRDNATPLQLVWEKEPRDAVLLWDMVEQKAVGRFEFPLGTRGEPAAWTITPGGAFAGVLLSTTGGDRHIVIWEAASGKVLRHFPTKAHDLELAPDGSLLATSDADGNIAIWSVAGGEKTVSLSSGNTKILCMAWARDPLLRAGASNKGWLLAAGAFGGDVTIWDIEAKIPRAYCRGSAYDVNQLAFSPDGMTLASVGRTHPMLWDVATGHLILRLGYRNLMRSLAFAPDGKTLAIGSGIAFGYPGGIDVWNLDEARGLQVLRGLLAPVSQVRFSPSGRLVAALAQNWQVAIWEREKNRLLHVFDAPKGRYADSAALAFDSDGRRFAFASGAEAKIWDVQTGAELRSWVLPPGFLDQMVFQAPDRLLLIRQESVDQRHPPFGSNNPDTTPRVCRVRDLLGPEPLKPLVEIKDFPLTAVAILVTPDGTKVVVEGLETRSGKMPGRAIKVFDSLTGTERWSLRSDFVLDSHRIGVVDPTGRFLAMHDHFFSKDILVDVGSGRQIRALRYGFQSLGPGAKDCFSSWRDPEKSDGAKYSLVRGDDEASLVILVGNTISSTVSMFSADGSHLAWGKVDGTVTVCDVQRVRRRLAEVGLGW